MMSSKIATSCLLIVPTLLLTILVNSQAYEYRVVEGDKFSKILGTLIPGPVWGKNGSFNKIIAQNPGIKDPDHILPNQIIQINDSELGAISTVIPEPTGLNDLAITTEIQTNKERTPASDAKANSKRSLAFEVAPNYSISALAVTDRQTGSQSKIVSNLNLNIDASLMHVWNDDFQSSIRLHFGEFILQQPLNATSTLLGSSQLMSGVGVGGNFKISQNLTFSLNANNEKEIFIRGSSTTSVTADSVSLYNFGTKISYELIHLDPFILGSGLEFKGFLPTTTDSYQTRFSTQYGCTIYLGQRGGDIMNFNTELGFTIKNLNTSITTQSEKDLTLSIRFHFPSTTKTLGDSTGDH